LEAKINKNIFRFKTFILSNVLTFVKIVLIYNT